MHFSDLTTLETVSTDPCIKNETRPDSPKSIESNNELVESNSTISFDDDEENTQSLFDSSQTELQLSILQSHDSVGDSVEDQKKFFPCQSPHDETLNVDSKHLHKEKSKRLISHIGDPFFEGNNVHEVHSVEKPVTQSCDRTCNDKQIIDFPVRKVESDNLAARSHLESTISCSTSLPTHPPLPDMPLTISQPNIAPSERVEKGPDASHFDTNYASFSSD